jgi:hypothetical protein
MAAGTTGRAAVIVLFCIYGVLAGQDCIPNPFAAATPYNLFSLGNVYGCNSDVEGRVALNGAASFTSYSIGLELTNSASPSLVSQIFLTRIYLAQN